MKILQNIAHGISILIFVVCVSMCARERYLRSSNETPIAIEAVAPAVPAQAPPVSAPACIHEDCKERPRFLQCVNWNLFPASAACRTFEISYERHCDCDRWAP